MTAERPIRAATWWPSGPSEWLTIAGALALVVAAVMTVVLVWPGGSHHFTNIWAAVVTGLAALGAALFSAAAAASSSNTARRAYGQQLYELARAVHADLTTGEVAQARNRLGKLVRDRQRTLAEVPAGQSIQEALRYSYDPSATDGECMRALRRDWFTLLWCFQRVHAAHKLLTRTPAGVIPKRQQSPRDFLAGLVRSQVKFLDKDLVHARAALEEFFGAPVDDHDSAEGFRELVRDLDVAKQPGRWADPISTNESETLRLALLETKAGDRIVGIGDLSKTQFDALHHAVAAPGREDNRKEAVHQLKAEARAAPDEKRGAELEQRARDIQRPPTAALPDP